MKKLLLSAVFAASLAAPAAHAYDTNTVAAAIGAYNIFDSNESSVGGKIEWRGADFKSVNGLSPIAGIEADTDSEIYGYAGILYDWNFADRFSFTPSFAIGAYDEGDGKDLGGTLEFRTTAEINYKVTPENRIGVSFSHISNAGIYDNNPGSEAVMAVFSHSY